MAVASIRLRNAAGAVRAAPGRRCADPGAPAVGMVRPRADAGRGHGARQYRPRSARARRASCTLMRRRSKARGNDEDQFAYLRDVRQYRNLLLVEQPNGDFARTMVRQFFYSAFADPYWRAMMKSGDATLAAIAAKSEKESAYHLRHSAEWMIRLGDGTDGKPSPRAGRDRRALGLYRRDVRGRRRRARADRGRHRGRSRDAAGAMAARRSSESLGEATLARPKSDWMQQGGRSRPPQRASRPSAQRAAIDAADLSGSGMVTRAATTMPAAAARLGRRRRAWSIRKSRC